MSLGMEYLFSFYTSRHLHCVHPLDRAMNGGLLNWLLCDYIKSVRVRKEWGGRRSGA